MLGLTAASAQAMTSDGQTIFGSATPKTASDPDTNSVELGVKFSSSQPGYITGIRFYKSKSNTGTHTGTLWTGSGSKLATVTFTSESATGWQTASFSKPVAITANTSYYASYHASRGHYADDSGYFSKPAVKSPLTATASRYAYSSGTTFPTQSYQSSNYYVDVVYTGTTSAPAPTPTPTPAPAAPAAKFSFSPSSPTTGQSVAFDGSGSGCAAGPCKYTWKDVGSDGNGDWALGSGAKMSFKFANAGTKYVQLTVTDAQNRSSSVMHQVVVAAAKASPTPTPTPTPAPSPTPTPTPAPSPTPTPTPTPTPAPSGTCDLNATPSSFNSQVSAAKAGQTVCLASGSYGTWSGTNKAITVRAASGATPTMQIDFAAGDAGFTLSGVSGLGGDIDGDAHDITISNSTSTDTIKITGDRSGQILFDHDHFDAHAHDCGGGCLPALWIGPGGTAHNTRVVVQYSEFTHSPGDGIQAGSAFTAKYNNFHVYNGGSCDSCHTDNIQLYGGEANDGTGSTIVGNYIHDDSGVDDSDGIVEFDGGGHHLIQDNVIANMGLFGIDLGGDTGSKVIHNTITTRGGRTGIDLTSKSGMRSTGLTIRDNVAPSMAVSGGGCNCTATFAANDHNMLGSDASGSNFNGTPTFSGGSKPTSRAGFMLASGSAGKGRASDGTDVGISTG
jgi:hypothetical protein